MSTVNVSSCQDCPFHNDTDGYGQNLNDCWHDDLRDVREIPDNMAAGSVPNWCPLLNGPTTVQLSVRVTKG